MSDFEKILDMIEEEIEDISKLEKRVREDEVFYLDKLNKLEVMDIIEKLNKILKHNL